MTDAVMALLARGESPGRVAGQETPGATLHVLDGRELAKGGDGR